MKKTILAIIAILAITSCNSVRMATMKSLYGTYICQKNSKKIELYSDGTYTIFKPLYSPPFDAYIEQCEIASNGKWNLKSGDVLELTSENYYLRQKGFDYEMKKENKFSQDSLYINIVFPDHYKPYANMHFLFVNYDGEKSIETEKTSFVIPKSEYLWSKNTHLTSINRVYFSIKPKLPGTYMYKSRTLFDIFEEDIDTDETNYITISLPYFNICFFEFEPIKDIVYIKNDRKLYWKGNVWEKQQDK